jgi:hypothetical protein
VDVCRHCRAGRGECGYGEPVVTSIEFDINAFEDLAWWIQQDRKTALRIVKLIKKIQCTPFAGTGKARTA